MLDNPALETSRTSRSVQFKSQSATNRIHTHPSPMRHPLGFQPPAPPGPFPMSCLSLRGGKDVHGLDVLALIILGLSGEVGTLVGRAFVVGFTRSEPICWPSTHTRESTHAMMISVT